ncbi:MAG: MFS transporter [Pseudoclavibacter sp.]
MSATYAAPADTSTSQPASKPANPTSRVVLASLIGTTIEFYDFYVYATAAVLVFPALFFPTADPRTAMLASFATFGAAMLARPFGAMLFGHLGDKHGRKTTLIASLLTMGIATFLIGLLPTYALIGVAAPFLLLVLRLCQGFALGGEWSGAALVATENAPKGKRAWFGTFPQVGAPIGFIIANGLFLAINFLLPNHSDPTARSAEFLAYGWRIPFLFSAVMVIIGLWVRMHLVESESFRRAQRHGAVKRVPLAEAFQKNWRQLILGTFAMLATYVLFYLMTTFTLTFGTTASSAAAAKASAAKAGKAFDPSTFVPGLGFKYTDFVLLMCISIVFFGVFTLISGPLADKIGRKWLVLWTTLALIAFGFAFPLFLNANGDPKFTGAMTMAFLVIGFTLMGLTFGPMGALLPEMFPTNTRYTGSAFAYNISSILGAAVAPMIAVALWGLGNGSTVWVGMYLVAMSVITAVSLLFTKETKDTDVYELDEID